MSGMGPRCGHCWHVPSPKATMSFGTLEYFDKVCVQHIPCVNVHRWNIAMSWTSLVQTLIHLQINFKSFDCFGRLYDLPNFHPHFLQIQQPSWSDGPFQAFQGFFTPSLHPICAHLCWPPVFSSLVDVNSLKHIANTLGSFAVIVSYRLPTSPDPGPVFATIAGPSLAGLCSCLTHPPPPIPTTLCTVGQAGLLGEGRAWAWGRGFLQPKGHFPRWGPTTALFSPASTPSRATGGSAEVKGWQPCAARLSRKEFWRKANKWGSKWPKMVFRRF